MIGDGAIAVPSVFVAVTLSQSGELIQKEI